MIDPDDIAAGELEAASPEKPHESMRPWVYVQRPATLPAPAVRQRLQELRQALALGPVSAHIPQALR
jgi:hypothetical protein